MHQLVQYTLPLLAKKYVAKDTCSFYFDRKNSNFDFFPGQHTRVLLPESNGKQELPKLFTIASSPLEKEYFMITTKKGKSNFKKILFEKNPGEEIGFSKPLGKFYLQDDHICNHVFLAGGIGITPFHSMLTYVVKKNLSMPIILIASFAKLEDMIFYEQLTAIKQKHIKIIYTLTKSKNHIYETGRISETLIQKHVPDIFKPTYHIAGSPSFIETIKYVLQTMKITEENIKTEAFIGYI